MKINNYIKKGTFTFFIFFLLSISGYGQQLRSLGIKDPANPNLDPNWKWYVDQPIKLYYTGNNKIEEITKPVSLPFFHGGSPLNFFNEVERDMYPEDGWMLVCRNFGTPSEAVAQPFFLLYNKYRGTLRFIFYNAQQTQYTYYKGVLSFRSQPAAIFTFNDDHTPYLDTYDKSKSEIFIGYAAAFDGWGYVDFNVFGYDPNFNKKSQLRIEINGVNESSIKLESTEFTLNQIMSDANLSASSSPSGNISSAINAGAKAYKGIDKAMKSIEKEVEEEKGKDAKNRAWWYNGAVSLVGSTVGEFIPGAGALVGFVSKLFLGNDKSSRQPINFSGSIKFDGTFETSILLVSEDFILDPTVPLSTGYHRAVQDIPIGIFNLANAPILTTNEKEGRKHVAYILQNADPNKNQELFYVFNEDSGLELTSMRAAYVYNNRGPSGYYPAQLFTKVYFTEKIDMNDIPTGFSIELKFKTKSPTKNAAREMTVYKVYPFKEIKDQGIININHFITAGTDLVIGNGNFRRSCQYWIAYNSLTFNEGFVFDENSISPDFPCMYFYASHTMNFNANSTLLTNKRAEFKIESVKDIQLKSTDTNSKTYVEEVLEFLDADFIKELDFNNLRLVFPDEKTSQYINNELEEDKAELKSSLIEIYPNPAKDYLKIEYNGLEDVNVTLQMYDISGKLVKTERNILLPLHEINVSDFARGTYIVKLITDKENYTERIILN